MSDPKQLFFGGNQAAKLVFFARLAGIWQISEP
jgi:hypothetical protein